MPDPPSEVALTRIERAWARLAPPRWLDSARAIYDLLPYQRFRQLPAVDLPYDTRREEHWADAARIADFASHLPPANPTSEATTTPLVLDVGPGDGWPAIPLAAARPDALVLGLEPSPRRTRVCRDNARRLDLPNAAFLTADAAQIPLPDATVHLATASYSLEESADPALAILELHRVLRPGGVLRIAFQRWDLPAPDIESVALLEGATGLLYQYARRLREPPIERRYTLLLAAAGPAAHAHREALIAAAEEERILGETRLRPGSPLGLPLLERLAPHATASLAVQLHRWTTPALIDLLRRARFSEVHATLHSGERGRAYGRQRIAERTPAPLEEFHTLTQEIGLRAAATDGAGMITAIR
jgi:SAM-dependent methyltransferase